MKPIIKLTAIALAITLCSCGDKKKEDPTESNAKEQQSAITHDSVSADFVTTLEEMSDTLVEIKDLESASSALPMLTKLIFKMKMIKTDMEKLGPASKNIAARLEKKYGPKMQATMAEIGETMESLKTSNPEAYGMIDKVMKSIMQ